MRLFYDNEIDATGVAITSSSEASDDLGAENVAHEFRGKVWRTGASVADESVVFDFGTAVDVTSVILLDHDLTAGDSAIKVQGNATNSWGSPSFSRTLTYAADIIAEVFSNQSFRWWRVVFTKSSSSEVRQIGRIFLGTYFETADGDEPNYDGFDDEVVDPSVSADSQGGQTWTLLKTKYDMVRLAFDKITNSSTASIRAIAEIVGTSISFFMQPSTTDPWDDFYYVKFARDYRRKVEALDTSAVWGFNLEFKEQL